jgi:hypothetical protein
MGKYVAVALFASVKFLFSPFFAEGLRLTFMESLISTFIGGMAGIIAFGLVGELISVSWKTLMVFLNAAFTGKTKAEARVAASRKFTRMNRFIVRVKRKVGLFGIAFLSPCLISIPVGAIACMTFYRHQRKRAFLFLFLSLGFWTLALNYTAYFLKISHLFSRSL